MNTYGCRVWWLGICLCCLHGVVAGESPPVAERQNPVYVEDSPGAEDLIAHAKRLQNNHRMREAVTTFQKVIDEYPFKLMSVESERYTDAALWVTAMIKSDTELLATYRRLHEPMAQRAFALASQPNLDAKALAQVVRRFRLCRGGLESALALAAWRLERADPDSAANTLADVSDHPDLNQLAARWHLLSAACALYQDDPHALARHHRALQSSGDHEALGQLNQWSSSLRRPPQVRSFDAMRSLPTTSVPEAQDDPLWRFDVPTPLPQVSGLAPGQFQSRNGRHTQLWRFVYMLPTAHGDRLYINDGRSVMALDRHAGRPLWSYHSSEPSDRSAARGAVRRMLAVPGHRGLAVHGDRLLAVVDHPTLTRARATQSYHGTSLVCLRGGDGQELWRVSPNDIDPKLRSAFFHSTPQVSGSQVFVMARRNQRSRFQDDYLMAMDVETGSLLWKRHLASAMPSNNYFIETKAQMTLHRGRLYVADNMGGVSCLDAQNGAAHWVSLVRQTIARPSRNHRSRTLDAPWQVSLPARLKAGLVVRRGGPDRSAVLLDPVTGQLLRKLEHESIKQAMYLTAAGPDLLCVGRTLWLLDGATLEPKWHRLLRHTSKLAQPFGRASIMVGRVAVPTLDRLIIVELANGNIVAEHPIAASGNILVLDDQFIVSGSYQISGYMTWSHAHARLTEKIANQPLDPMPALALTRLALDSGHHDATLVAVDAVLVALERRLMARSDAGTRAVSVDPIQQQVFNELLTFLNAPRSMSKSIRRALYSKLSVVTATASDEVEYRLSHGSFLASSGQHRSAMDRYQSILDDPTLATQMHRTKEGEFQASLEAQVRQTAILKISGPQTYAHLESVANQHLEDLTRSNATPAEQLVALARRYPISHTAAKALLAAAERMADEGRSDAAITALRDAYRKAKDPPVLQEVFGRLVELNLEANRPARARWWLHRLQREHKDLEPLRGGQPVPVAAWLAELADQPATTGRLPELEIPFGRGTLIQGQALAPSAQNRSQWLRDRVLTLEGANLQLRRGDKLQVVWTARVPSDTPIQLLALTADQVLLWIQQTHTLLSLDVESGKPQWRHDQLKKLLDGADAHLASAVRFQGQQIRLIPGQVHRPNPVRQRELLLAMNDMILALANASGHAIALDRRSGRIEWRRNCPTDVLTHLVMDEQTVALAGLRVVDEPHEKTGAIFVLDSYTGAPRVPLLDVDEPVTWLGVQNQNILWYTTPNRVVSRSLLDNSQRWQRVIPGESIPGENGLDGGVLMLRTKNGRLRALDASTGREMGPFTPLPSELGLASTMEPIDDQWHLFGPKSAMALARDGQILWVDAIADADKRLVAQLVGARYVVVINQIEPMTQPARGFGRGLRKINPPNPVNRWVYRLYLLDRRHGMIRWQRDLPPLPGPLQAEDAMFLDNRLVLPTESFTVLIPGSGAQSPAD